MSPEQELQEPSDDELFGLFERRRPSADAFAERVQARIREREAEAPEPQQSEPPAQMGAWARVAALLPVNTSGLKLIPAAFAWPILVLAAGLSSFFYGRRSLSKSLSAPQVAPAPHNAQREKPTDGIPVGWLSAVAYGGPLVALLLGGSLGIELVLGVVLCAMLCLVLAVRGMAAAGQVTRLQVCIVTTGILMGFLVSGAFSNKTFPGAAAYVGATQGWTYLILSFGVAACFKLSGERKRAWFFSTWALVCVVVINPFSLSWPGSSPKGVASQLESMAKKLDVADLWGWEDAAALHGALVAVGGELPDLSGLSAQVASRIRDEKGIHAPALSASIDMGLLNRDELAALSAYIPHRLETHGISATRYRQFAVPLWLANETVDGPSRAALAEMALGLWPANGDFQALASALDCVRLLELLGREDLVADLAASARELLGAYWVAPEGLGFFSRPGGFMAQPIEHEHSSAGSTLDGVRLMARFGIPAAVDPFLLRGHLRQETAGSVILVAFPNLTAKSSAALLRLERQIGVPNRSWFAWLLAQRPLIIAALLVALCISAVRMAPPGLEQLLEEEKGALP